jgi:hypothetical protein
MKTWCDHIIRSIRPKAWLLKTKAGLSRVPPEWRGCPICLRPRPTNKPEENTDYPG